MPDPERVSDCEGDAELLRLDVCVSEAVRDALGVGDWLPVADALRVGDGVALPLGVAHEEGDPLPVAEGVATWLGDPLPEELCEGDPLGVAACDGVVLLLRVDSCVGVPDALMVAV